MFLTIPIKKHPHPHLQGLKLSAHGCKGLLGNIAVHTVGGREHHHLQGNYQNFIPKVTKNKVQRVIYFGISYISSLSSKCKVEGIHHLVLLDQVLESPSSSLHVFLEFPLVTHFLLPWF